MPNYYNPYYTQPVVSQTSFSPYNSYTPMMPAMQPQSYAPGPSCAMAWVDGEIEARGRQMPQGVTQYAMWDTNKQVIYLKSLNQMGMPNPMQIIHYTIDDQNQNQSALTSGQNVENSNNSGNVSFDMDTSQFVTKQDFEQLRNEIRNLNRSGNTSTNQNGNGNSESSRNRGGNR